MVTNQQLYLAIGVPMLFNATLIGLFADAHRIPASTICAICGALNSAAWKK